jgi:hypothetical protein
MYKLALIHLISILIFSSSALAQMTKQEYDKEKKELIEKRERLTTEINSLNSDIDSLKKNIPELEQQLVDSYQELFELKYGKEIGQRIAYKRIWKGMTDEMVKDGWGEPDRIDKNVEPWGVFTQWIYGEIIFFFRDGKLTDWQEGPEK